MIESKRNSTIKQRVLFICTHNSVRSQMAEGLMNEFLGHVYQAFSAGTEPGRIHPLAVKVMHEIGVDISRQHSKGLDELKGEKFDYVVTVCDFARETCPIFPGGKIIHEVFEDPAAATGTEQEKLTVFRNSRDEIRNWIKEYFEKQVS